MRLLNTRKSLLRAGALAALLAAGSAMVVFAALPAASGNAADAAAAGLENGTAQGANGQADLNSADGTATAADQLSANLDRLNSTLNDVIDRLMNGNAADAAVSAVQAVVERLGGDVGLNHAIDAVGGDHGAPSVPDVATDHPSQP
jgi:hypothetical protein